MPGWSQRPLFKNPTNMTGGGPVGMPKGMSIPGYEQGSVVQGGDMVEEMPAYRQEQLAKEAEYQKAIEKTASLFLNPFQGLLRDYDFNLDYFARNLSGGHQIPKEQVMQDLRKSISAQRKEMPVKEGFMGKARRRYSGIDKASPMFEEMLDADGFETKSEGIMEKLQKKMGGFNSLGNAEDINFAPTGLASGGIVGLENGGMMPELFEGEEIVETNPTINEMAGQGGTGIASVSAEPASGAMPERNVPNERGIIELAMDAEEVEDDEPMVAMAKQEAQSLLDQEFNILKSTAKAEAASGNSPSMVIKSGMDDLARSARRIENEVTEKYPEVPANTNLISSDDLIPYREQLVAVFEMPEIGGEEPLMDTSILTAKNGGKIPGYQDGGVADVPEEWSWIDEDIRELGVSLDVAEQLMEKRYEDITKEVVGMAEQSRPSRINQFLSGIKKRKEAEGLSFEELAQLAKEEADKKNIPQEQERQKLLGMLTETPGFEIASKRVGGVRSNLMDPKTRAIYDQYKLFKGASTEPLSADQGQTAAQTGGQGQGDPVGTNLPTLTDAQKEGTLTAGPAAIPSAISSESIVAAQEEMKEALRKNLEDLKTSTKKGLEDLSSPIEISMEKYETQATAQDETMEDIFADIERRIPIQAKVSGRLSPFTGGGAQASLVRGLRTQEVEQNLFQKNNANKIEFYNLRKQETEARRNKDFEALQNIKLKQLEIIEGIDNTLITETMKLDRYMLAQRIQLEIAQLEVGSKLGAPDYDWSKQLEDVGQGNQTFDQAVENMIAGGNAQYIIKENIVSGRKNIANPGTNQDRNITFREFYETKVALGVPIKEIVEEWSKLPKAKTKKS